VLNGRTDVKPENLARVQSAVRKLRYQANSLARSMRTKTSRMVGCLVTDIAQPIAAEMVAGAEGVLWAAGYATLITNTHQRADREAEILRAFKARQVDGLLLVVTDDEGSTVRDSLRDTGIPFVLWERDLGAGFDTVLTDHGSGTEAATRHLLELGHDQIVLVAAYRHTWGGREQSRGYTAAMASSGKAVAPANMLNSDDFDLAEAYKLFNRAPRPTAVIANIHDIPLLRKAAQVCGLQVPADLSLISIGDSRDLEVYDPPITAVRGDGRKVGIRAAELICNTLEAQQGGQRLKRPSPRRVMISTELIVRQSTAIAPSASRLPKARPNSN
jgi:LacI family transcriptional regulator